MTESEGASGDNVVGWLFAIALYVALLAVGVALVVHGARTIAGAYDDPVTSGRCSESTCVTVVSGVTQPSDGGADLIVRTERGIESIDLIRPETPETGTRVALEYRGKTLVSVLDPSSGRQYHTEDWPRHTHDVVAGIALVAGGSLLDGLLLIAPVTFIVRVCLRLVRRRARRSSAAE